MQHIGTRTLETPRLILRRFCMDDAQALFENGANDPAVTEFLTWQPHANVDETRALLAEWVCNYDRPDFYLWAIVPKDGGAPIGSIAVVNSDERVASAHVGYCIGRPWWRQGITSEALAAVMDELFEQARFLRIESRHDPNNPHSGMVMQKCGMCREGLLRSADRSNRGICDAVYYGLLKSDYDKQKALRMIAPDAPQDTATNTPQDTATNVPKDTAANAPKDTATNTSQDESADAEDFLPGRYRHFKGREYELLYLATHSETRERLVVYRALYGECGVWVRPARMWNERVACGGQTVKRFSYIGAAESGASRP